MDKSIYDLLLKKATKLAASFDLYPLIPRGDLTAGFCEKVFEFNVYTVLDILESDIINTLIAQANGKVEKAELLPIADKVCNAYDASIKAKMLEALISNFRNEYSEYKTVHSSYMTLQPSICCHTPAGPISTSPSGCPCGRPGTACPARPRCPAGRSNSTSGRVPP